MPIETGFILAAGMGSRMGEIGKTLPKVLWPVFETTLLGLQINFLIKNKVQDIYVNSHHCHDQIQKYCSKFFPQVTVLPEIELLDAGGGVHNFIQEAKQTKPFVLLNSDQFIDFKTDDLQKLLQFDGDERASLVAMNNIGDHSSLNIKDEQLVAIEKSSHGKMYIGLAAINPAGLRPVKGASKFFETVCNYKKEKVLVRPSDGIFLDFGSIAKYSNSNKKLLALFENDNSIRDWWVDQKMLDPQKIDNKQASYNCEKTGVLNFSGKSLHYDWPAGSVIISEEKQNDQVKDPVVVFNDKMSKI